MEYDNNDTGSLWRNEDKDDQHPNWADYTGSGTIGGREYFINAWVKEVKKEGPNKGKKFFSISFKEKEQNYESQIPEPAPIDDSVPF